MDLMGNPRDMWIIYFGTNMPMENAAEYEQPFEHIKKHVYPVRKDNRQNKLREQWWLFEKPFFSRQKVKKTLVLREKHRNITAYLVAQRG